MAYYDSQAEWIAHLKESFILGTEYIDDAFTKIGLAESEWWGSNDHDALGWVIYCLYDLIEAVADANEFYGEPERYSTLIEYLDQHCKVTWQTIVQAWIADNFAGRAYTIATIDKMRQILWDEPFEIQWAANIEDQGVPT